MKNHPRRFWTGAAAIIAMIAAATVFGGDTQGPNPAKIPDGGAPVDLGEPVARADDSDDVPTEIGTAITVTRNAPDTPVELGAGISTTRNATVAATPAVQQNEEIPVQLGEARRVERTPEPAPTPGTDTTPTPDNGEGPQGPGDTTGGGDGNEPDNGNGAQPEQPSTLTWCEQLGIWHDETVHWLEDNANAAAQWHSDNNAAAANWADANAKAFEDWLRANLGL